MDKDSKIYIAGHKGMVGSAILRKLQSEGYGNIITKSRQELNLTNQAQVEEFFKSEKPEYVFLSAAKVGGIEANRTQMADFTYENLQIQNNIIHNSYLNNVKKLVFLGSSCIYPKYAQQPIKEEYLLTGPLEETNYGYAIAKIAGLKLCQAYQDQYGCNFVSAMPTNLYGINDNFNLQNSHVLPALIRKFHEAKISGAKSVEIWGTGKVYREFLYVDDLADCCIFIMQSNNIKNFINVGTGKDISIYDLAHLIKDIVGFNGQITFDILKPDGTPKKLLDISKINSYGFKAKTSLEDGIKTVYNWYLNNENNIKK